MRSWKWLPLVLSFALVAGLLAGCAGQTAGPKTLNVVMGLGEPEWQVMREHVIPAFEQAHNAKVNAYQVEAGNVVQQLEAMKTAGQMEIDLITQDNMALAPLVEKGLVEDLSAYRNIIPQTAIPSVVSVGEFDGRLYFLPYRPNVEINFFNSKYFDQYGLRPPATWDELLTVARTLKEQEGVGRVGLKLTLDGNTTVQLFEFIRQAGGDPMVLNDAGSVQAFTFLKELYPYLGSDAATADWNTTNQFLSNESFYLAANWPFGVGVIVQENGKEEIHAYGGWSGPAKRSKVLGGEVIGIPAGAPNKELAVRFAEHLMSREVQEVLASRLAWPSYRTDAYGQVEEWQQPYFDAINEAMKAAEPRPNVAYWDTVDKSLNNAFREIVIEGADIKATLDRYSQVIADARAGS